MGALYPAFSLQIEQKYCIIKIVETFVNEGVKAWTGGKCGKGTSWRTNTGGLFLISFFGKCWKDSTSRGGGEVVNLQEAASHKKDKEGVV